MPYNHFINRQSAVDFLCLYFYVFGNIFKSMPCSFHGLIKIEIPIKIED